MADTKKAYLGDGAYVQHGSYQGEVVLTTENGISVQNRVVLSGLELVSLLSWLIDERIIKPTEPSPSPSPPA